MAAGDKETRPREPVRGARTGPLPSGTVSLLFSDIEGSTLLLSRLGSEYADAIDGQRQVLRAAWASHGGTELGTEGDSFFVVFETAAGAVAAAAEAQRELAQYPWPRGERLRVRMGIHTGTPTVHDGGYVGMDVHRAARIAGAAHGGQVVMSQATASLAEGQLTHGASLRDLGWHQLKDIKAAEHLFQLVVDALQSEFPALKSLGPASTLPMPATPLVGRSGELADLSDLVLSRGVRVVTLTGPGGTGKTRLATELAHRLVTSFLDGVYFVPLDSVTTTDVMWTTIAEALDVSLEGGNPLELLRHVAHRRVLLVLDNLEQLPGADSVVSELLTAAPQTVIVATSRRPLHVAAEHEHAVPPLELPRHNSPEEARDSGAVQLFVQHARKVKADFDLTEANAADVVQVCRRLDGLPLAIELAAARSKLLTPAALVARLGQTKELRDAGIDRPIRQRTLSDTIAWSYNLLNIDQQSFFRRLAIFASSADLAAVSAVTSLEDSAADPLDLVAELADASLVNIGEDPQGEPRVGMLETIRDYARHLLAASGEERLVQERHLQWALQRCSAGGGLTGPEDGAAIVGLRGVLPDLKLAVTTALANGWHEDAARIVVGARRAWFSAGRLEEMTRLLQQAQEGELTRDTSAEVAGMLSVVRKCLGRGGVDELSAAASRLRGVATADTMLVNVLCHQAAVMAEAADPEAVAVAAESVAVARRSGTREDVSMTLDLSAYVARSLGQLDLAVTLAEDAVDLARGQSEQLALALASLCASLAEAGRRQEALEPGLEAVARSRASGVAVLHAEVIGTVTGALGSHLDSSLAMEMVDAIATWVAAGSWPSASQVIATLAREAVSSQPRAAAGLFAAAQRLAPTSSLDDDRETLIGILGLQAYVTASAEGAMLSDDAIVRLAREAAGRL